MHNFLKNLKYGQKAMIKLKGLEGIVLGDIPEIGFICKNNAIFEFFIHIQRYMVYNNVVEI